MTDLALEFSDFNGADLVLLGTDLATDDGLEPAVYVSLFCDKRARPDQIRTGEDTSDLRGFWGDIAATVSGDELGSHLWLLRREKQVPEVLTRAKKYAEDALKWMIDDFAAKSVIVTTEFVAKGVMGIFIEITRPDGEKTSYKYDYEWSAQAAKRVK